MTYKEIVKKKEYFQNITWIHLSIASLLNNAVPLQR